MLLPNLRPAVTSLLPPVFKLGDSLVPLQRDPLGRSEKFASRLLKLCFFTQNYVIIPVWGGRVPK